MSRRDNFEHLEKENQELRKINAKLLAACKTRGAKMSETKHTPGPWEYFEQKEWGRDSMYGCVRAPQSAGGFVIVNGCAPGGTEEQKANARLIAAAPNLLAALKQIAEGETQCCPRCQGNGRLWADGKVHYPSEQRDTILCGNCGGSGRLQPDNAQDIAAAAIALAEK